jgi:hypothetical protein
MDYSCADEVIAKLLMRYVSPERPVDAYFLARGLQEHHLEAVEAVLERHGLLLAAKDESRGEARLLGPCTEVERECWSVLVRRRRARQEELAEAIGLLDDALDAVVRKFLGHRVVVPLAEDVICAVTELGEGHQSSVVGHQSRDQSRR